MKKIVWMMRLLIVFSFMGIFFVHVQATSYTSGDFTFQIESDGNITIIDYSGSSTDVNIPASIVDHISNTRSVTAIGPNAFESKGLTSITIPTSITSIGYAAFKANNLNSVSIPDSVEFIGNNAFTNNATLSTLNFNNNNSITTLGTGIFSGTNLAIISPTSFNMGIDLFKQFVSKDETFFNNHTIATVDLTSVEIIGTRTFAWGTIDTLSIPTTVTTIKDGAFEYNDIDTLNFNNKSTPFINFGTNVFSGNSLELINTTTLSISNSVLKQLIETDGTFGGNLITDVTLPLDQTTIGAYTFGDNEIETIDFPSTLTTIKDEAFAANYLIELDLPNQLLTIGDEAFIENALTEVSIPASVTSIGNLAFAYNEIHSITFMADMPLSTFADGFVDEDENIPGIGSFASAYSIYDNQTYYYSTFDPDRYDSNGTLLAGTYSFDAQTATLLTANPNLDIWGSSNSSSSNTSPSTPSTPSVTPVTTFTTSTSTSEPLPQTGITETSIPVLSIGLILYVLSRKLKVKA